MRSLLFGMAALITSLVGNFSIHRPAPTELEQPTRILFVVWDGVRANDVAAHLDILPNLRALSARGASWLQPGTHMRASGPNFVSMPGYAELLTGEPQHGCMNNDCAGVSTNTLLHDAPNTAECAAFTSWSPIARHFSRPPACDMTGSFGRTGTENSLFNFGWRDNAPYRPDGETIAKVQGYLAGTLPQTLFVSLGDTDEAAHDGSFDGYIASLKQADAALGAWLTHYAGTELLTVVTTDHGRAKNFRDHGGAHPESQETWAVVTHSTKRVVALRPEGRAYEITQSVRNVVHGTHDANALFTLASP